MSVKKIYFSFLIILIFQSCYSETAFQSSAVSEERAFSDLMKTDSLDRKVRAAAAINQFLNDQPEDTVAAVLIENSSNCNIIVKINGAKNHLLPIPKYGKNFLVLKKEIIPFNLNCAMLIIALLKIYKKVWTLHSSRNDH